MARLGKEICKFALNVFNLLSMICSILLTTMGTEMVLEIRGFSIGDFNMHSVAIITLICGCGICLVSFLGCWGTLNENIWLLNMYTLIMLCFSICQVILASYIWLQYDAVVQQVTYFVHTSWKQGTSAEKVFHLMESQISCCGETGYKDYLTVNRTIPASCCEEDVGMPCNEKNAFKSGCVECIVSFILLFSDYIKYSTLGTLGVMIAVFLISSYLAQSIKREKGTQIPTTQ